MSQVIRLKQICSHERSHMIDSRFHGGGYRTSSGQAIFCDECRLQRWLDVEAALAEAQGELGIIPSEAAHQIVRAARLNKMDLAKIADGIAKSGHSLFSLVNALCEASGKTAGEFVHFGATTQDIQDTAQSIELREVLNRLDESLLTLLSQLERLVLNYRDHVMVGRTHSMPALPTTFGFKVASWADEVLRNRERIEESRSRILVAQLFGGVGTMAAFGDHGLPLLELFAKKLGLGAPLIGWHTSRDRVAEYSSHMAMVTATAARIADEIRTLCRDEIGELRLAWNPGQVGSSTMPHKRNPEDCEQIVVLARLTKAQLIPAFETMIQEHERDYRGTRLEWPALAEVSHYALTSVRLLTQVLTGLQVDSIQMEKYLIESSDRVCTEPLMMALARTMGRKSAFALVYELSQSSQDQGESLKKVAMVHPLVLKNIGNSVSIAALFDPTRYLGSVGSLIDRVLERLASVHGNSQGMRRAV